MFKQMFGTLILGCAVYLYCKKYKNGWMGIKSNLNQLLKQLIPETIALLEKFMAKNGIKKNNFNISMSIDEARAMLGVDMNATNEEINKSFKKLMLLNHPDKGGNEYIATKLIEARNLLIKK